MRVFCVVFLCNIIYNLFEIIFLLKIYRFERRKGIRKCVVKVMALVMCIGIFSASSITVEANETLQQGKVYGERVSTMKEYEAYLDSLSAEEIEARNVKIAMAQEVSRTRLTRTGSRLTIPGTFTMYQQQKDYYCIPACVQSILTYINGTSPTQADIA